MYVWYHEYNVRRETHALHIIFLSLQAAASSRIMFATIDRPWKVRDTNNISVTISGVIFTANFATNTQKINEIS